METRLGSRTLVAQESSAGLHEEGEEGLWQLRTLPRGPPCHFTLSPVALGHPVRGCPVHSLGGTEVSRGREGDDQAPLF